MGAKIVAASMLVLLTACGSSPDVGETETTSPSAITRPPAPTTTPPPATPQYSVIGTSNTLRYDGETVYFVVINPVDLSNDSFKQDVKLTLQAVAQTDGGPDFSAQVFDDEPIATRTFSQHTDPQSDLDSPAFEAQKGQHLVASYTGGLGTTTYPYELWWYPSADSGTTPNAGQAGQYVDIEEWKPQV